MTFYYGSKKLSLSEKDVERIFNFYITGNRNVAGKVLSEEHGISMYVAGCMVDEIVYEKSLAGIGLRGMEVL